MTETCSVWPPHRHSSLTVAELASLLTRVPANARVQVWWRDTVAGVNVVSSIVDVAPAYRDRPREIVALLIGGEGAATSTRVETVREDGP
jgi:hypothetical protein